MSQYFKSMFSFINFVLFNYFVCLSFCDKQSFEVLFFNDSALEIIQNFDSNSSLYNNISPRSSSISTNNHKFKSESAHQNCQKNSDCLENSNICCPLDKNVQSNSFCIFSDDQKCKGYYGQECVDTNDCEKHFDLKCLAKFEYLKIKTCRCSEDREPDYTIGRCESKTKLEPGGSAMQIYKITMIFASCCLAFILIIFLVCILRKSYCTPRRQVVPLDNNTIPDIFTLFPHVGNYDGGPLADGTLPPFEKPPTYDETLTLIRNEIGIPPPAYRSGNTPNSSNQSSPSMSTRVLISNPTLFVVNSQNSRTNSGQNSPISGEGSLAGPSGSGASHQGIDNPAFC